MKQRKGTKRKILPQTANHTHAVKKNKNWEKKKKKGKDEVGVTSLSSTASGKTPVASSGLGTKLWASTLSFFFFFASATTDFLSLFAEIEEYPFENVKKDFWFHVIPPLPTSVMSLGVRFVVICGVRTSASIAAGECWGNERLRSLNNI